MNIFIRVYFWLTQKLAGLYVDGKVLNILLKRENSQHISNLHFLAVTYIVQGDYCIIVQTSNVQQLNKRTNYFLY